MPSEWHTNLELLDTRASPEPGRMDELPEPPACLIEDPLPLARFLDSSSLAMSLCNCRHGCVER